MNAFRGAVEPGAPKIASHCRTWLLAVSDEIDGDRPFYQKCEHNGLHDERCAQCDEFLVIQVDTRAIIMDLDVPDERAKMLDVAARCFGSEGVCFDFSLPCCAFCSPPLLTVFIFRGVFFV